MLTKYVQWASVLPDGRPANYLIDPNVKVAAAVLSESAEIHPEIVEFIENLQPEDTKSYVLAIAMGCGGVLGVPTSMRITSGGMNYTRQTPRPSMALKLLWVTKCSAGISIPTLALTLGELLWWRTMSRWVGSR